MLQKDSPILLVDDSMAMRHTVEKVLASSGYTNVHVAANGKEALVRIRDALNDARMFHVIFLDWNMPEMNGLDFLKACRIELDLKDVAIIMLTAMSDQKSVITALNNGATSYIAKPVSAETIIKKLDQVGNWIAAQGRHS